MAASSSRRRGPSLLAAIVALALGAEAGGPASLTQVGLRGLISASHEAGANEHGHHPVVAESHGHEEHATGHGSEVSVEEAHGHETGGGHEVSTHGEASDAHGEHGAEEGHEGGHATEHGAEPGAEHGSEHGSEHGGGHGEGHGEGHGGGHGHHEVSAEERSIAYLMMFAVAAAVVLLFFVSYSDPDVRCASSKMACTAVSVYCAVLLNQAVFSFVFDQVLVGKDFRGLNLKREDVKPWMRGAIGGIIFLMALSGLNFWCWRFRESPNSLVAASQLGAHMVAWAGINAFGSLQESDLFHEGLIYEMEQVVGEQEHELLIKYILVIILGLITFITVFHLSHKIRTKVLDRLAQRQASGKAAGGSLEKKPSSAGAGGVVEERRPLVSRADTEGTGSAGAATEEGGAGAGGADAEAPAARAAPADGPAKSKSLKPAEEEEEPWLEELSDGEREAMALVLGFLTMQTVVYAITGKVHIPIHGLHGRRPKDEVILILFASVTCFIFLLWAACYSRKKAASRFNFRGYLAMTMAWLFERAGEWFMHMFFDNLAFARIWNAFLLTGFAILATILIDKWGDTTRDRKKRSALREGFMRDGVWQEGVTLEELIALDKFYVRKEQKKEEPINGISVARLTELHKDLRDETPTDLSVQTLCSGFSVLIGIVWDMAFESAEEIIVSPGQAAFPISQGFVIGHPVVARCILAFILCAIVLPGWVYYIVPPSRKAWRHHLEDILLEQRQVPRLKKPGTDEEHED